MIFKKTATCNAQPTIYNGTAYLHDTQLVMRNDEMYETCDIHNYYFYYKIKKEEQHYVKCTVPRFALLHEFTHSDPPCKKQPYSPLE